jgi:glucose/arabinose dehydrogenase
MAGEGAGGESATRERRGWSARSDLPDPPTLWLTHYPRMLAAYRRDGEDGLADLEEALRTKAAEQSGGKFSKRQAAYVPFVPLPPVDWRHKCGHCRFWVDHGPGEPGQCMIVGREGDYLGGKAIHEEAACALFMPPAGEPAFEWVSEQASPTGADLVRGEYHSPRVTAEETGEVAEGDAEPTTGTAGGAAATEGGAASRGGGTSTGGAAEDWGWRGWGRGHASRTTSRRDVGDTYIPAGATVGLERVATGLAAPLDVAVDPADPDRRFVLDQAGQVYVHTDDGLREEPLLDVSDRMVSLRAQYDERGLLGMALHPEFADNGRLFVRYSATRRADTPAEYDHTEVLAEVTVDGDRSPVDPDTETPLLEIPSPQFNHNGGDLAFGPDGHLYVPMGDGGSEGDRGTGHVDGGNGQDVEENLLGGILRIDVDSEPEEETEAEEGRAYAIPDDNPLVDGDGLDEYYAWGLRNPWRVSFDSDGRLFAADVGQHLFEEVNVVEKGGNYGWNVREGFHCFDPENPTEPPADCPRESARGEPLRDPVLEYPHIHDDDVVGSAIVGGHVYEGSAVPALEGAYVFGDWTTTQDRPSGRLFAAREDGGEWDVEELVVADTRNGRPNRHVLGFSRDPDGELYLCANATHVPKGSTGAVYRIVERG